MATIAVTDASQLGQQPIIFTVPASQCVQSQSPSPAIVTLSGNHNGFVVQRPLQPKVPTRIIRIDCRNIPQAPSPRINIVCPQSQNRFSMKGVLSHKLPEQSMPKVSTVSNRSSGGQNSQLKPATSLLNPNVATGMQMLAVVNNLQSNCVDYHNAQGSGKGATTLNLPAECFPISTAPAKVDDRLLQCHSTPKTTCSATDGQSDNHIAISPQSVPVQVPGQSSDVNHSTSITHQELKKVSTQNANVIVEPLAKLDPEIIASSTLTESEDCALETSSCSSSLLNGEEMRVVSEHALTCQVDASVMVPKTGTDISPTLSVVSPTELDSNCDTDVCVGDVIGDQLPGVTGLEIVEVVEMGANCKDLQLAESEFSVQDVEVSIPEVVAAETIVVTSTPPHSQKDGQSAQDEEARAASCQHQQGQLLIGRCSSCEGLTSHTVTSAGLVVTQGCPDSEQEGFRMLHKRERERLKKREMRQDPDYKAKERELGRARMQNLRRDPQYRERERSKDRQRRWMARQTKPELRLREKQRDREHKRRQKTMRITTSPSLLASPPPASPSISHEVEIQEDTCVEQPYVTMDV